MKSERVLPYEAPRVETLSAAALLEMIGPVQGYAVGIGSPNGEFSLMGSGGDAGGSGFGR